MNSDDRKKEKTRRPESRFASKAEKKAVGPKEIGGPAGPEPTRFGDWERRGRCIDF